MQSYCSEKPAPALPIHCTKSWQNCSSHSCHSNLRKQTVTCTQPVSSAQQQGCSIALWPLALPTCGSASPCNFTRILATGAAHLM